MNRLTVLIPCKNESRNIRDCVESARSVADEILVADSGSTDGTRELVDRLGGCRLIQREYRSAGDFKNWAMQYARGNWVFVLDADERITPELAAEIRRCLHAPVADGFFVRRDNYFMGHLVRFGPWGTDRLLRLFRRSAAVHIGDNDHAEVQIRTGRIDSIKGRIAHFTCWTYDEFIEKQDRYCRNQAELWHRKGKRPNYWKLYLTAPLRFCHMFFARGGFLDGVVGLQVAMAIAYFSYQKQARLWQLTQGGRPPSATRAPQASAARKGELVRVGNRLRPPLGATQADAVS